MAGRTPVGRGRYRTGRNPDAARQYRPARDGLPLRMSLAGAFTCCSPGPVRFRTPPRQYGAIHWAIWGNELTQARIVSEFDQLVANGIYVVNLAPARGMTP